jgi:hypothetical protein
MGLVCEYPACVQDRYSAVEAVHQSGVFEYDLLPLRTRIRDQDARQRQNLDNVRAGATVHSTAHNSDPCEVEVRTDVFTKRHESDDWKGRTGE